MIVSFFVVVELTFGLLNIKIKKTQPNKIINNYSARAFSLMNGTSFI